MTSLRHDRKRYLNVARERIQELEELLRADVEDPMDFRDLGWDNESLRDEVQRAQP